MIEKALFQILTGHAELTAHVGDRVYPLLLPQSPTLPAITYTRVGTARGYNNDGPDGAAEPSFQISVWTPDLLTAATVAGHARAALHGAWNATVAGVRLGRVTCSDDRAAYDQNGNVVGAEFDVSMQHRE